MSFDPKQNPLNGVKVEGQPSSMEMLIGLAGLDIALLKRTMEEVAGEWNGDEPAGEEKATCAKEIAEKCAELETLLDEMAEYL